MNKLYILCGLPYSGKTYLAKEIVKQFGFIQVSIDDILFAKGFDWDHFEQIGPAGWQSIFNQAFSDIKLALKEGKTVIYDSANQDRSSRNKLRTLAQEAGVEFRIIWLNIPLPILKQRWLANQTDKKRFHLPDYLFQAAVDSYEPPDSEDNVLELSEKDNLTDWINKNLES